MRRRWGIIAILVGVGLFCISILMSSGSSVRYSFLQNIPYMKVVLVEGNYVKGPNSFDGVYDGRIAIPLRNLLSLAIVLVLTGTGMVLTAKPLKSSE